MGHFFKAEIGLFWLGLACPDPLLAHWCSSPEMTRRDIDLLFFLFSSRDHVLKDDVFCLLVSLQLNKIEASQSESRMSRGACPDPLLAHWCSSPVKTRRDIDLLFFLFDSRDYVLKDDVFCLLLC